MKPKRKRHDSENASQAPKKIMFEGQVVKLTKDGEPDMRFAVSRKLVALQTWSMEKALGIELILERIFEHLPYADLKNARSANSFWNRIANPLFRKRSIIESFRMNKARGRQELSSFSNCQDFIKEEAALQNQNLVAKVPLSVATEPHGWEDGLMLMNAIQTKPVWFSRVQRLCLYINDKFLSRFLPFFLHQMSNLQELCLNTSVRRLELIQNSVIPAVPADAMFSVAKVAIDFDSSDSNYFRDVKFLCQCPNLKTFRAYLYASPHAFMDFFKAWKQIRSDSMQYENIEILNNYMNLNDEDTIALCKTLAEFININQCRSLNLDCIICERFLSTFTRPPYLWTLGVLPKLRGTNLRQLKLSLPIDDVDPSSPLRILQQHPATSKVTDLTLMGIEDHPYYAALNSSPYSSTIHNLESVTSLTFISSERKSDMPHFRESFPFFFSDKINCLQNITSVRFVADEWWRWLQSDDLVSYKEIFETLTSFSKLVELELGIVLCHHERQLEKIKAKVSNGAFATLGMLTGLRKLRLMMDRVEYTEMDCQNALVIVFNGYEPHVNLEMKRLLSEGFDYGPAEWTFTVEEFKEALKAAETLLLTDP